MRSLATVLLTLVLAAPTLATAHAQPAPGAAVQPRQPALGPGEEVAPGVRHYRLADPSLLEPAGPIVVHALRLDPARVELTADLALGGRQGRAPVADAVRRREAIAGVNAGFFDLASGDPLGPLRVDGALVSHAPAPRGAAAISERRGRSVFRVDRVALVISLEIGGRGRTRTLAVDGIDTTRTVGGVMLYTPRYGETTATAASGIEWTLHRQPGGGDPVYVVAGRHRGDSRIPRGGLVLSYGGPAPPAALADLAAGTRIRVRERWTPASGRDADGWGRADDVVNGAGVLVRHGRAVREWEAERLRGSFLGRHPRTIAGVDGRGDLWLITVDGRQPGYSDGMTLVEAQRLALALGLTDALNLDGGGSTTMVIGGEVVNRPSDLVGPRPVSDVLLVLPRPGPRARAPR